jgi:hypothetical protein
MEMINVFRRVASALEVPVLEDHFDAEKYAGPATTCLIKKTQCFAKVTCHCGNGVAVMRVSKLPTT